MGIAVETEDVVGTEGVVETAEELSNSDWTRQDNEPVA